MRTLRGIRGSLLVASLALAACSGSVSGIAHPTPPTDPGDDIGDDAVSDGGGPGDDGSLDSGCTSEAPIGTGFACSTAGLSCPLGTLTDCNGDSKTLQCSCTGQSWACDPVTTVACPAPAACPDPSQVSPGGPCANPAGQVCNSTDFPVANCGGSEPPPALASCQCLQGTWSCELPVTDPCISPPAQTCPDPNSVAAGGYCNVSGQDCPGNPTYCDGQVYYDALVCAGTSWLTVATTDCDLSVDGGTFDGGTFDGAQVLDGD